MKKPDPETIQAELEKKHQQRRRRKKPAMKVSGRSVRTLQRIIVQKGKRPAR